MWCGWLIIFVYRCFLIYRFLKVGGPVLKLLDPPPFGLSNFRSAKFWFRVRASHFRLSEDSGRYVAFDYSDKIH